MNEAATIMRMGNLLSPQQHIAGQGKIAGGSRTAAQS
jgi:hypothetical protein